MTPILQCKNVTVVFGGIVALRNLNIEVNQGEIHGVIGPNGAGKTTLFNVITGMVKPVNGDVLFCGRRITGMKPHQICKLGISRTHQLIRVFKNMTVLENTLIGAFYGAGSKNGREEGLRKARSVIKLVGLERFEQTPAGSLDVFHQKLVEISRALATDPKLLLLDEPVAGLTQRETENIMQLIQTLRDKGITIILVEHVLKAVMSHSDRISVINEGEKIFEGTPREVGVAPKVVQAYLGDEYRTSDSV